MDPIYIYDERISTKENCSHVQEISILYRRMYDKSRIYLATGAVNPETPVDLAVPTYEV